MVETRTKADATGPPGLNTVRSDSTLLAFNNFMPAEAVFLYLLPVVLFFCAVTLGIYISFLCVFMQRRPLGQCSLDDFSFIDCILLRASAILYTSRRIHTNKSEEIIVAKPPAGM